MKLCFLASCSSEGNKMHLFPARCLMRRFCLKETLCMCRTSPLPPCRRLCSWAQGTAWQHSCLCLLKILLLCWWNIFLLITKIKFIASACDLATIFVDPIGIDGLIQNSYLLPVNLLKNRCTETYSCLQSTSYMTFDISKRFCDLIRFTLVLAKGHLWKIPWLCIVRTRLKS